MNTIHGSDSPERAAVEVDLFFAAHELVEWEQTVGPWVVEVPG